MYSRTNLFNLKNSIWKKIYIHDKSLINIKIEEEEKKLLMIKTSAIIY